MNYPKLNDFAHLQEKKILSYDKKTTWRRHGGELLLVIGSLAGFGIGMYVNNLWWVPVFSSIFAVPGLVMVISSQKGKPLCRQCSGDLERVFCKEMRSGEEYSGSVYTCGHCKTFQSFMSFNND